MPLTVHRPYAGELELDAAPTGYAQPLATLVAERFSLHLENDRLRRADLRRQAWLTFLAEASELLAQSLDVEPDHGADPATGGAPARPVVRGAHHRRLGPAATGRGHATPTSARWRSCTPRWPRPAPIRSWPGCEEASRLGTQVMLGAPNEGFAVPLVARGQRLGTLAVGRHQRHRHDADEVAVLEDVARRAALAIDNARIHDERRRVARTLQASLLPPALPHVEGVGFAAEYVPTGSEVGGDFYDVVPLPDGPLAGRGRRRLRQGRAGGHGDRPGPRRDPDPGRRRQADDRDPLPGQPDARAARRRPVLHAGDGHGRPEQDGDRWTVCLHLAGHDRAVLVRGGRQDVASSAQGGTALGLLETISSPDGRDPLCSRATR